MSDVVLDARYDLSVVAPCFNESANLAELVERLQNVFALKNLRGEIVLVNDGSLDNTGEVIDRLARQHANLVPVHHQKNQGIEQGWKSGVAAAHGAFVCLIDADLQNLPEDVWRLYREIQLTQADVVQGVRSSVGRERDSRYYLSRGLNVLLNLLFGMHARDNKSGFILARREVLEDILRHRYRYRYFQTFIGVAAHAYGYRIHEIETLFESRLAGKSFLSTFPLLVVLRVSFDLIRGFIEFRLYPRTENVLAEYLERNPPARYDLPLSGWRRLLLRLFFLTTPLHKWLITRKAKSYYYELRQSQWLSREKIRELQEIKLRKLIHHAYHHVAYYRELFDTVGLRPEDVRTLDDLQRVPFLTKSVVRQHLYFDLLSDNHDKNQILKIRTSGSTGEPFVCYADRHQLEIRWAATLRSMEWTGYRFGDRQARLWHQTIGMTWSQIIREKIDAWFNRRLFIPAFEMTDENIERFVAQLQEFKPVFIDGYAESFNFLAHYLKHQSLEGIRPRGIMSSAQILPDQSREIIERAFGCGVFDKYGSREFSGIAYECEAHDGHHVVAESYVVELIKDGRPARPGELGEVVVTDLNNFCMPFIRYRLGDLAVAMDPQLPCPCGRGLPRIGKIEGRVQAIILGTNKNFVPGTFFAHLFKDYDHIVRQFEVVQEELGSIDLKIIKASRFNDEGFAEILRVLHRFLGEEMRINVQFVDHIPMVRTGKHTGSISRLNLDFQQLQTGT